MGFWFWKIRWMPSFFPTPPSRSLWEWVMSNINGSRHIWMRCVTHTKELCHNFQQTSAAFWWISHFAHVNKAYRTYEWVMSHISTRYVTYNTHEGAMSHIWTSHVTHMNESCHTWQVLLEHLKATPSQHPYEWVMPHTYECITPHIWTSHAIHMNEPCHTYERVMSHI